MKAFQTALPFRLRAVLLAGLFCLLAGAGLIGYRLYLRPTTLTIAVGRSTARRGRSPRSSPAGSPRRSRRSG